MLCALKVDCKCFNISNFQFYVCALVRVLIKCLEEMHDKDKNVILSGTKPVGRHAVCVESINNNLTPMCDIESK